MKKSIAARARIAKMDTDTTRVLNRNAELMREGLALQKRPENRSHDKDWFRIENASAAEADVYIYDEIGFWGTSAQGFIDELNSITAPRLNIHVNSPGGEVFDGVAIHSALMATDAHVTVFIDGLAASAASFIAMAGDRIIMARHATMMIHDASGLCWGNPADMAAMGGLLDKLSNNIADMYSLQAGGTVAEWRERMQAETWYTGQEALAAGLVDEITGADAPAEDATKVAPVSRLSLAAFNFSGRAEAPAPVVVEPVPEPLLPPEEEEKPDIDEGETLLNYKRALTLSLAARSSLS